MKYPCIDYTITQTGKELTSASSIKINKYDNKVSRLVFNLDGTIPEHLRLYCAFLNPKTKKYFFDPVITDLNTDEHYAIIGTDISYYQGRWEFLLIGIGPEYSLDGYDDIDETIITYVSNSFKRIMVVDNFLSDNAVAISFPTIDKVLDDYIVLRDTVLDYTEQTGEDVTAAQNILEQCQQILDEINEIVPGLRSLETSLRSTYNTLSQQLRAEYERYAQSLRELGGGD